MDGQQSWRLLPGEKVVWKGRPAPVARARGYRIVGVLLLAFAVVSGCFGGLLLTAEMTGGHQALGLGGLFLAMAIGLFAWPRLRLENVAYMVTDRRVLRRAARSTRFIELASITYARIHWHRDSPVVGHLELVVATPYGPLRRRLRLLLEDVREPDRLWALIRGQDATEAAGDSQVPLVERLDEDEQLVWSGRPAGFHLGWREITVTLGGLALIALAVFYAQRNLAILLGLEDLGLQVRSAEWVFLFSAVLISWVCILMVGFSLVYHGFVRARQLGQGTEYVLTQHRLLIRRGLVELSLDRARVVDVAERSAPLGLVHLYLVLDGPRSRALAVSGAMNPLPPARAVVPPVLFDLRNTEAVRAALIQR